MSDSQASTASGSDPTEEESLLLRLVRRPDLFDCVGRHLGHRDYVCAMLFMTEQCITWY